MRITIKDTELGITEVVIIGDLDIAGSRQADAPLESISDRKQIAIDLSEVGFLASIGIRTLLIAAKAIHRQGGRVVAFGQNERVEKVLKRTGTESIIPLFSDRVGALSSLA